MSGIRDERTLIQEESIHMLEGHDLELLSRFIVRLELQQLGKNPKEYGIQKASGGLLFLYHRISLTGSLKSLYSIS